MPKWSGWDVPDGIEPWSKFHWYKIKPSKGLDAVVLSEKPVCYIGHYYDSRMWPCGQPHCSMCSEGLGKQIRYVFAIAETTTHRPGLIEVSDSVALLIRSWMDRYGGLRGMHLFFSKMTHSVKSRVVIDYVDETVGAWWKDVDVPDCDEALSLTWSKMNAPEPSCIERPSRNGGSKGTKPPAWREQQVGLE